MCLCQLKVSFVVLTSTNFHSDTTLPSTLYSFCGVLGKTVSVLSVNAIAPKSVPSGFPYNLGVAVYALLQSTVSFFLSTYQIDP